ncbi:MAG: hypothetical protein ACI35S_09240 [Anaeroplasma sp.]
MNKPLLFIDSVTDSKDSSSNQEYFDSRTNTTKAKARYRLEDIEAMLYYRIHVLAEIRTKNKSYEGIVLECSEAGLILQIENDKVTIPLHEIEGINILKL